MDMLQLMSQTPSNLKEFPQYLQFKIKEEVKNGFLINKTAKFHIKESHQFLQFKIKVEGTNGSLAHALQHQMVPLQFLLITMKGEDVIYNSERSLVTGAAVTLVK
jgi:hypothetical protein